MTNDELKQLAETLSAIAEGKEWEYQTVSGRWVSGVEYDPLKLANLGRKIRIRPEPEPDPYAELKAAHAAGKTIQVNWGNAGKPDWVDHPSPGWTASPAEYRVKPWSLPPPPEGRQWHKAEDWTEEMLPPGYRPVVVGEAVENETSEDGKVWNEDPCWDMPVLSQCKNLYRTTAPLPEPKRVPLEPDDIKAGDEFCCGEPYVRHQLVSVGPYQIKIGKFERTYEELLLHGWLIRSIGETEWRPCWKEVQG